MLCNNYDSKIYYIMFFYKFIAMEIELVDRTLLNRRMHLNACNKAAYNKVITNKFLLLNQHPHLVFSFNQNNRFMSLKAIPIIYIAFHTCYAYCTNVPNIGF